jgi:hypothetical protein
VADSADSDTAKASTKPAWRNLLVKDAVIFGSLWLRDTRARFQWELRCAAGTVSTVTALTRQVPNVISITLQ